MELVKIPEKRREYYLRIVNDKIDHFLITQRLYYLNDHFPIDKLDHALKWLVINNVIGDNFINWFKFVCKQSDLFMHKELLSIVENDQINNIIYGKNFRG